MNLPAHNDDNGASEQVEPEDDGMSSLVKAVVFGGGAMVIGLLIVGWWVR